MTQLIDPRSGVKFIINKLIGKDDCNKLYIGRQGRKWVYIHWCLVSGTVSRVGELYDRSVDMDPKKYAESWSL